MRYETLIIIKQKSGKFAKNPCNYCGDGVVSTATNGSGVRYEECDPPNSTSGALCNDTNTTYVSGTGSTVTWNGPSTSGVTQYPTGYFNGYSYRYTFGLTSYVTTPRQSSAGWVANSSYKNSGSYSLCTTPISGNHNNIASYEFSVNTGDGNICFYWYGGSEADCDKFYYYLDGDVKINGRSGSTQSWTQQCDSVSKGTHTLRFEYYKDRNKNQNVDMYCIDTFSYPAYDSKTVSNPAKNKTCSNSCKATGTCHEWCGDSIVQNTHETCDKGSNNTNTWTSSNQSKCTTACKNAPYCGDGIVNGDEDCESGQTKKIKSNEEDCDDVKYYYFKCSSCKWAFDYFKWE